MILFKACPRCGGDVDASYQEDAYCIQCSHRPDLGYPGPRVMDVPRHRPADLSLRDQRPAPVTGGPKADVAAQAKDAGSLCPRCDSQELIPLDRLRSKDNFCYRCRPCGHIFSPAMDRETGITAAARS